MRCNQVLVAIQHFHVDGDDIRIVIWKQLLCARAVGLMMMMIVAVGAHHSPLLFAHAGSFLQIRILRGHADAVPVEDALLKDPHEDERRWGEDGHSYGDHRVDVRFRLIKGDPQDENGDARVLDACFNGDR